MDVDEKLRKLIRRVYHYVARFLFKEDLMTFVLHVIHDIYPSIFQPNVSNRDVRVHYTYYVFLGGQPHSPLSSPPATRVTIFLQP